MTDIPKEKVKRVAVLIGTSTGWGRDVIRGINQYAMLHNWILYVDPIGLDELSALPTKWKGEGIIARIGNQQTLSSIRKSGLPCVNVSAIPIKGSNHYPRITTDHRKTAEEGFRYFYANGFRHYGYFGLQDTAYVLEHEQTFVRMVEDAGCSCSVYEVPAGHPAQPTWNLRLSALEQWLKNLPKPCGILTWNVSGAQWIIHAANHAGLPVPEQVSVLNTAEDDFLCTNFHIPISSIALPTNEIGVCAAEMLDQMMTNKRFKGDSVAFPPKSIIKRTSTDMMSIADPVMVKALIHIRQNAHLGAKECTVGSIAKWVGVCRRKLELMFLSFLNRTVHDEIQRTRIERAARLLVDTELSITGIAANCGFATIEHFATVFKKTYG
ncbi:MAG: XylR family transcriptional regulator, partial [bacterium]